MTKSLLYKSAFILGVSSLLSKVLGVVRDSLLASQFGTSGEGVFNLDIYYAAFRVPDFVYALLVTGAVAAAFVPVFTDIIGKNNEKMTLDASRFTSNVLNTVLIAVSAACFLMFLFAPFVVKFLVPGFSLIDFELTVAVTKLMLISPILFGISSVLQSVQNTFSRFFYYSLAPILYNVGIICGILFLVPVWGVWGIAWGVLLGAFLHLAIQIPGVCGLNFRYNFYISWKDSHLREMVRLMVPRILGMSIMQVNLIFDTLVGSMLAAGSITVLNYAVNLNSLPMGLVGVSFAIASFATLSGLAIHSRERFAGELARVVTSVLYFVVPSAVGLFVLRFQIVNLILGYGEFTDADVILTGNTLAFFLIGLIGQSLIPVFARAFYAFKNTLTPVVISVVCMSLNIGLNFYFALSIGFGVYGIALATGLTSLLNMILLIIFLKSSFLSGASFIEWKKGFAITFASTMMGVVVYFTNLVVSDWADFSFIYQISALFVSVAIGVIVFVLSVLPFHLEETEIILGKIGLQASR